MAKNFTQLKGLGGLLLTPGGNIRRWLLIVALGGVATMFAVAYVVRGIATISLPDVLPGYWEAVPLLVAGAAILAFATTQLFARLGVYASAARPDETLKD